MNKNGKVDAEDFKMLRKKKSAKRVVHSDKPDSLVSMKVSKEEVEELEEGKLKDMVTRHMDDGHSFDKAMEKAQADLSKMKPAAAAADKKVQKDNLKKTMGKSMQKEASKPSPAMADAFAKLRAGGSRIQDGPSNVTKTSTGLIHKAKLAKGPKYGVTDFTKNVEDSEAEGPKGSKRKSYGARQNKVRSTRVSGKDVNESFGFTSMLESYQEKGLSYIKEMNEEVELLDEKNKPTNPALWSRAKAAARSKFDVYPSAYANGWAAKWYKKRGGSWKSVKEEVEQLDELSPKTLGSYAKKAQRQTMNTNMAIGANPTDNPATRREKAFAKKRKEGASRAIGKLVQKKMSNEEYEQLDELSPKTLGSYAQKSVRDLEKRDRAMGKSVQRDRKVIEPDSSKPFQKMAKRRSGLTKAINRLSKEELEYVETVIDQLEEATPTKKQVKQGIGIARDKRYAKGNMSGAVKAMDKVNKGIAQHPAVAKELRKQNESSNFNDLRHQLDELSAKKLGQYQKKALDHVDDKRIDQVIALKHNDSDPREDEKEEKLQQRQMGIKRASDKLVKKAQKANEEVEQLDELKSKTLKSYISKAGKDLSKRVADYHSKDIASSPSKIIKRDLAIDKAKGRLSMNRQLGRAEESVQEDVKDMKKVAKELAGASKMHKKQSERVQKHVDQMNEKTMTDSQMDKREKIVMAMKPKMQGFKDRYGDDAKSVMYATATKQAMKD